ncbi:MAG: phosphoribosylanthranilate isomerase [Hyphomicrobiaceae bacterium]
MAKVKICGLNSPESMQDALLARADLVGLVFFPPSPRHVSIDAAVPIADYARGFAAIVALTVDAEDALIADIMAKVNPDMLQLHGSESPARVAELRERYGKPVMKAIKVATRADAETALAYRDVADLILFDAKPPKGADRPGGHGATFDWSLLDSVKLRVPFMLSGGLTPHNVAAAIHATGATVVDVSSGVETAPGVKNPALIRAFIAAAHSTHAGV